MSSFKRLKIASVVIALLFSAPALLTIFTPNAGVVLGQEGFEVIARGKLTAFSIDQTNDPPWKFYEAGQLPPVIAAKRIGKGAVVAGGLAASCRDGRWNDPMNPHRNLDRLLDAAFQWMVPGAMKVLWYEGYEVYNNTDRCSGLVAALSKYYIVDGIATAPITADLLAPYDILVIPQLQLGVPGTGGDPSLLPDADVEAIVDFVKGGKGLLIMEASDFYAYQFYKVQNKILEALESGIYFQNDQINDFMEFFGGNQFQPIVSVDESTEIGAAYKRSTGKTEVGLYSICSVAGPPEYNVTLSISPLSRPGKPGETITFEATVKNIGLKDDTYSLAVRDSAGWGVSAKPESLDVGGGKSGVATLEIKVPDNLPPNAYTIITVTVTSQGNPKLTYSRMTGTEVPGAPEIGRWTVASRLFPYSPGYGVTVAGAGESIYVTNTTQLLRFNTLKKEWEELPVPGMFANGASLCWDRGNYIYAVLGASYATAMDAARYHLYGGTAKTKPGMYVFRRYNIERNRWEALPDTPWFQGAGCALAWANGYIYALLGTSSSSANPKQWLHMPEGVQFWRFNVRENKWDRRLADVPYGADDGANLVWAGGNYLYAFPGAYDEGLLPDEERHFLRYNIRADNWEELEKVPFTPKGGIDDGGSLVWPGGENLYALKGGDHGGSEPASDFWCYNIPTNTWVVLENVPASVGENNGRRLGIANGSVYYWRGCYGDGTLFVYGLEAPPTSTDLTKVYIGVAAVALVAVIVVVWRRLH